MKTVLITGGLGYIGSHAVVAFEQAGYKTVIVDNLDNSCLSTYRRIGKILGYKPIFYEIDLRNIVEMDKVFQKHKFDAVIHFAGLKSVLESCDEPLKYFDNNLISTIKLCELMEKYSVKNIIFSGSAVVYNGDNKLPYTEDSYVGNVTNPYGTTKYLIEKILKDLVEFAGFNVIDLRYFNPIGAHETGLIGEYLEGTPSNIFPYILKVIIGEIDEIKIFGNDYDTVDGTGVRDFIDINDLIDGHIKAMERLLYKAEKSKSFFEVYNLGVGRGVSVLELIKSFEKIIGKPIKYKMEGRRLGDLGEVYCSSKKAFDVLGWKANNTIEDSIKNSLKFYYSIPEFKKNE